MASESGTAEMASPERSERPPREAHVVTIEILGRRYKIESEHDPKTIRELAAWVDERIRRVHRATEPGDAVSAAVLAALNIADDYFQTRRALERREKETVERTRSLAKQLREALEPVNEDSSSIDDRAEEWSTGREGSEE